MCDNCSRLIAACIDYQINCRIFCTVKIFNKDRVTHLATINLLHNILSGFVVFSLKSHGEIASLCLYRANKIVYDGFDTVH